MFILLWALESAGLLIGSIGISITFRLVRREKNHHFKHIHQMEFLEFMIVAGFRPGSRGPFVTAKGPKTSDAPSGLIKMGRTRA
jgi:hypothetical protein